MFSGWTENIAVKNRANRNVGAGIQTLVADLPYPMTGLDFDNGGKFINVQLIEWAEMNHLALTRDRPYKHNDNAHVDQRNRDWAHKQAFSFRYETSEELFVAHGEIQRLWHCTLSAQKADL